MSSSCGSSKAGWNSVSIRDAACSKLAALRRSPAASSTRAGATRTPRWSTYSHRRARIFWPAAGRLGYARKAEGASGQKTTCNDEATAYSRGALHHGLLSLLARIVLWVDVINASRTDELNL